MHRIFSPWRSALLSLVLVAAQAHAATITVTTTAGIHDDSDGRCSLLEAIDNASWDSRWSWADGECEAGSGDDLVVFDTIVFPAGQVTAIPLGYEAYFNDVPQTTVDGAGRVALDAQSLGRIFTVESFANAKLMGLQLRNGKAHDGHGGAILVKLGNTGLEVENSTFTNNQTTYDGGAIGGYAGSGWVSITGSTFVGNTASQGGAIFVGGALTITNSTVTGNTATTGNGGGIYTTGTTQLHHVTLVGNTGSGVRFNPQTGSSLHNSILAANTGGNCQNAPDAASGNLFAGNLGGCTTAMGVEGDVLLGALGANGGPTATMLPGPGSAARDAVACLDGLATDQRGQPRPVGAMCDIGAVERRDYALTVAVTGDTTSSVSAAAAPTPVSGALTGCTSTGGTSCTAVYTGEGAGGDVVTLTATPGAGAQLTAWGGACEAAGTAPSTTVTVTQALACSAAFAPLPPGTTQPVQPVPTLSQTMLAALALLMAALAGWRLRGRARW